MQATRIKNSMVFFLMVVICSAGLVLSGAVQAQAQNRPCGMHPGMPNSKWWQSQALSKDLGLTAGEKQSLDDLFVKNRNTLIDLKGTLMKERFKLQEMLEKGTADEKTVLAQNQTVQEARLKISNEHIKYMLGMQKILGPDRYQRLMTNFQENRGHRYFPQGGKGCPAMRPENARSQPGLS